MDIGDTAGELLSPAALRIIRRHRPDSEDPRYCRACGRPTESCDVVALARVVTAQLRLALAPEIAPLDEAAAPVAATRRGRTRTEGPARGTPRVVTGARPQPGAAPI